ncbi:MAG: phenylalanine--tRNA ligase subunit beta [Candidatus Gracilibacteria bacterium]|nr:phenylalanine--tRNA ligase subunit beta [Candidatus Gracilibacteria bacterium]
MKISYNTLKRYLPELHDVETVAQELIMHTAEVEEIHLKGQNLKDVYIGEVLECERHPDGDKLNLVKVRVKGEILPIVCGASNVKVGIRVPVAVVGAKLTEDFVIQKTKIRGEESKGMICSEDELGLKEERQEGIMILPDNAPLDASMREFLEIDDAILEVDNKAINHRPDMFSHIGTIRELATIFELKNDLEYLEKDFSSLPEFPIENRIPEVVHRYSALKISGVNNTKSPCSVLEVLGALDVASKGILVDVTNYSLYFYGQPTHAFDADKINGKIIIRYAENGEKFVALNDEEYELTSEDMVIADEKGVIALAGVIGGKYSAVTDETKNIILESAKFDQAKVRKTGRIHGVRTDSLNVFEKDIPENLQDKATALVVDTLEKVCPNMKLEAYGDSYNIKQEEIKIRLDVDFINNLIGKEYSREYIIEVLNKLGIKLDKNNEDLIIPFWRTDMKYKADIAEEIVRIHGYNNVEATIPEVNLGAVNQSVMYNLKNDTKNFFVSRGFYELYNYSITGKDVLERAGQSVEGLIPLKNFLSEEGTHMRVSLIPGLLASLEENIRDEKNLKLFEFEKAYFIDKENNIDEKYHLASVITSENEEVPYYAMQKHLLDFFKKIGVQNAVFEKLDNAPEYAHAGRVASVVVRGKSVGVIGEIHPFIAKNFDVKNKIAFFELNMQELKEAAYSTIKAEEISIYQENNFDLSFVIDKNKNGKDLYGLILKSDKKYIDRVELIDIYENEEKMPGQRSLTFKVYISSLEGTLDDNYKAELIKIIVAKAEKQGFILRG